jgi:CxxC motif-containing protein (DUF1111 family)
VAPTSERAVRLDRPDMPLTGMSPEQERRFDEGDRLFEIVFRAPDGLGPRYVRDSCAACHERDGRGPGRVTRLGLPSALESQRATLLRFGDVVRPLATHGVVPAALPPSVLRSQRLPPPVFGRGALEAVAEAALEDLAARAAARAGPIKGRPHRRAERIGRFGVKAQSADLDDFVADALLGDMGLTSPRRPDELPNHEDSISDDKPGVDVSAEQARALAEYVRLLDIPARTAASPAATALFERVGCATCHVPSLPTAAEHPLAALAGREVAVYTDLLLHDLGASLADGVREGDASGRELRTAPLIGLRFMRAFLHDGRAATIEAAILAHAGEGSEANEVVTAFDALAADQRRLLLEHVAAL